LLQQTQGEFAALHHHALLSIYQAQLRSTNLQQFFLATHAGGKKQLLTIRRDSTTACSTGTRFSSHDSFLPRQVLNFDYIEKKYLILNNGSKTQEIDQTEESAQMRHKTCNLLPTELHW
jgi:hypothetical protein